MNVNKNETYSGPSENLSEKVVRGGVWVFSLRVINRGLGFVRTVILARLLSPNDFGLLGISLLSIAILETFSQTGFQAALVQKNKNVDQYLDTAWTVSVIRGIFLFLLLFILAPYVAIFFNSPDAIWVIRAIAISFLLNGWQNVGIIFFQKELKFNRQFVYELSGTMADFGVAIVLAFILRSVWALIWGMLAANFCRLFASYMIHSYRPSFRFEKEQFKELFNFGQWILGSSVLTFLITQGDDIFVGKYLGVTALGLYQMAFLISNLPATEISHVISRITFPAFASLQNEIERAGQAFRQVLKITVCLSAPVTGEIFILASDFTNIFLGPKWLPIVPIVKWLVIAGFIRSIAATTVPVFHGIGKPKIDMAGQILRLAVLAALIYPFSSRWGLVGVSIAVLTSTFTVTLFFIYRAAKITIYGLLAYAKILILPVINSALMILAIHLMKLYIQPVDMNNFFFLAGFGLVMYLCMAYLMDRITDYRFFPSFKKIFYLR